MLPAHLESNFINPGYGGAQPAACLRLPSAMAARGTARGSFSGRDILAVIEAARSEVGIVTLAPELAGGIDLVRALVAAGHRVSLGHSGADFDDGDRRDRSGRASRDASLQPHAAARPSGPRPGRALCCRARRSRRS